MPHDEGCADKAQVLRRDLLQLPGKAAPERQEPSAQPLESSKAGSWCLPFSHNLIIFKPVRGFWRLNPLFEMLGFGSTAIIAVAISVRTAHDAEE